MIAIVMPTRGLVFTEVEDSLEDMRTICKGIGCIVLRSSNLPIPDGHNELTKKALMIPEVSHILFVEEDTVMPKDGFIALAKLQTDIACIDYGVNGWSCVARQKSTSEVLWCGLGCTLVKREVFEALKYPYFRSDKSLRLNDWQWIDNPSKSAYGGHDIWFCCQARKAGFTIKQAEGECRHLQLDVLGTREINNGFHEISQKSIIKKQQIIDIPEPEDYLTINNHRVSIKDIGNTPQVN